MGRDILTKSNYKCSDRNRQSGGDRRPVYDGRSDEEKFLHGKARFTPKSERANSISIAGGDVVTDPKIQKKSTDKRSDSQRRSSHDRRCGSDTRSEVEQFLQGERRSSVDRRSGIERRYRSFKKARAFVRDLGLRSVGEWRDYIKSGMRPDDIPVAPHYVYANDGWAGWGDWLGASAVATYFSQYRSFEKARAFVYGLGLVSDSKWRAYCKSAKKPDDIPANPQSTYAGAGWAGWGDWLGYTRKHQT